MNVIFNFYEMTVLIDTWKAQWEKKIVSSNFH